MVHLPVRRAAAGRRTRPVKRASFWISWTRLFAALLLVAVSGAFYWLTVAPQFALAGGKVSVEGAQYTDPGLVRSAIALPEGANVNLYRLRTQDMRAALEALPAVLAADVRAILPDRLSIVLHERAPIFVWRAGDGAWLTDVTGVFFAQPVAGADPAADALPVITDGRADQAQIQAGGRLDAQDLETAKLLGALTPERVGSSATSLALSVDDADGWVLTADTGWRAIFGHYTPVLQTTAEIPAQVQCLRSLLMNREAQVATVKLAVGPNDCGTFLAASPSPGRTVVPGRTAVPGHSPAP
jgi:cell division septal protein FtsQ